MPKKQYKPEEIVTKCSGLRSSSVGIREIIAVFRVVARFA